MPESENTPETAKPDSAETRKPAPSELESVAALLRGDEPDKGDQDGGDEPRGEREPDQVDDGADESEAKPERAEKQGAPKTLNDLAERLGVKAADLYALEIPHGDNGESFTLGELKDIGATKDSLEVDRLNWEESKAKKEREFLRAQSELSELVSMLPKSAISQELLDNVARRRAATAEREEAATLRVIDAWQDGDVRAREEKQIDGMLEEYGLPRGYLNTILDHRVRALLRDSMLRKQRIEAALEQVKTVRKPGHSPSKRPQRPSSSSSRQSRRPSSQNKTAQVAELLRNG